MANINFLNTVDLNQNQLNKAAIQNVAVDPVNGVLGQLIFNTAEGNLKVCVTASLTSAVWSSAQGDIKSVNDGTYISITNPNGPDPIVNHDATSRTDTTSTVSGVAFPVVDSVTTNATGHVTAVNVKTVTVPDVTTYDLTTIPGADPDSPGIRLTGNLTGVDDVTISGTTGQTAVDRLSTSELRVKLTDDVTIIDDLTVGGEITSTGTGQNAFAGQVTIPLVPAVDADAASKRYVDQSNIGQSIFQGGYNAATNTPDLDVAPSALIKKGWFWAVTDTGSFFSETVQPGDLIYADQDNPGAVYANFTVVQSGQDIATAGSTDGGTVKGIAGFDSAHFAVSANGWAQLKPQSNPYGAAVVLTGGVDAGGETTFTVDITSSFGAGALAENCITEVVTTSGRHTVFPSVTGNGTGSLIFKFIPVVANSTYTALISYI
jgi:hypothetical protein